MNFSFVQEKFLPGLGIKVELSVDAGQALVLVGENGIGKSSLLRSIWQKNEGKSLSWITQEANDFFYDRTLKQYRKLFLQSCASQIDQPFFDSLWDKFGLEAKGERLLSQLSGGESQLVKLACGLAKHADVYLCDEPTQFLDADKKKLLMESFAKLLGEGKALILVEHDQTWLKNGWKIAHLIQTESILQVGKTWTI